MSFVAVAIGGSAVVGAGASLYASSKQSEASNNALDFQKQAYNTSQSNINAAKTNYQPYLDAGSNATYKLSSLMGGNGTAPDYSSFYSSPDYKFAQQQGELGIERGANARGMNLSGGTLKDLASYNSGLATQQYGNYYNRLMGLSQLGSNAASGLGNLATGQANNSTAAASSIGNTTQSVGQSQASGAVGVGNAVGGGVSNSLLYNYLNKSNPSSYSSGNVTGSSNATGAGSDAQYNNWGLQNGLTQADL